MGRSAKVHKRVSKKLKSTAVTPNASSSSIQPQVQAAKKRGSLKQKTAKESGPGMPKSKGVLGGADYVTLLMGGRRKVEKEAKMLPKDNS